MKRRILIGAALAASLLTASPAHAYHERSRCGGYDDGNGSADCSDYGGQGNHNRRREDYEGAGCKYICPSFDKSPVHDAFNFDPQICMPGATCSFEDRKKKEEQPE